MTPRAVVDTSSLVPSGLRRELQQAAQLGLFVGIWSPWIIAELNRVLVWRWITHAPPDRPPNDLSLANEHRCGVMANRMMALLLPTFEHVNPMPPYPTPWESLQDLEDHPIWAAAVVGQAHFVISENTRHYPPVQPDGRHVHDGVQYIAGHAFLDLLSDP